MRLPSLRPARVAFVTALVTGVAMIATSIHGMLGIDRRLEQAAQAAQPAPTSHVVPVRDANCAHAERRV